MKNPVAAMTECPCCDGPQIGDETTINGYRAAWAGRCTCGVPSEAIHEPDCGWELLGPEVIDCPPGCMDRSHLLTGHPNGQTARGPRPRGASGGADNPTGDLT